MVGYASPVAPLVTGGFKITIPASIPIAIIADPEVLRRAPHTMTLAGFGDLLGKYNSRTDWRLTHIVTGEYYCGEVEDLVNRTVDECVKNAAGIGTQSGDAVEGLIKGLILSGIWMLAVGNSWPASGAEHSLSHYWEVMSMLKNRPSHFHGTQVGVGTSVMAKVYRHFFARDPHSVDLNNIKRGKSTTFYRWQKEIKKVFGAAADRVITVQTSFFLDWEAHKKTGSNISRGNGKKSRNSIDLNHPMRK